MIKCRWIVFGLLLALPLTLHSAECVPTPHRTTGTHYKPVTEYRIDVSNGLLIRGRVLAEPDCEPVPNARVAHWQADASGEYVDRLRAYLYTDDSGHYEFRTEWPNLSVPHIHFIIMADGYQTLETQWVGEERVSSVSFNMVLRRR